MHLDLDSLDSVRAFAKEFNALESPLHCLINNAGVFDMSGAYKKTRDAHEQHYGRASHALPFSASLPASSSYQAGYRLEWSLGQKWKPCEAPSSH